MKEKLEQMGKALFLYDIVFSAVSSAVLLLAGGTGTLGGPVSGLLGLGAGGAVILRFIRTHLPKDAIFHRTEKRMGASVLLVSACYLAGVQLLLSVFSEAVELVLKLAGLCAAGGGPGGAAGTVAGLPEYSLGILLYVIIAGPVVEEVVFRGGVLKTLEPWGRRSAILAASALFGIYHGSLSQGLYAFAVGVLFGYLALEYSIWWSMGLHVCSNGLALLPGCLMENRHLSAPHLSVRLAVGGALLLFSLLFFWRSEKKRPADADTSFCTGGTFFCTAEKKNQANLFLALASNRWILLFVSFNLLAGIGSLME